MKASNNIPSAVEVDQLPTGRDLELQWKIRRSTRITSSGLKKLNTSGRGGKPVFGDTAIKYITEIVMQIKENDLMESDGAEIWQMQFGKDNEPLAIEWLRDNFMETIRSGSKDFGDILFMCVGDHFGDSPDGLVYPDEDSDPIAWLEIKCPANKLKACMLTSGELTIEDVIDEYRDQFIGHFIGNPNVDQGWYVIYNAHFNELTGKAYNRGVRFVVHRKDFERQIAEMEAKIEKVYRFIRLCVAGEYKPENINGWWGV